jgi:hypothetical protein
MYLVTMLQMVGTFSNILSGKDKNRTYSVPDMTGNDLVKEGVVQWRQ